jgi:hypothetical protein
MQKEKRRLNLVSNFILLLFPTRGNGEIELTRSMTTLNLGLKTGHGTHHKKYLDPVTADLSNKGNNKILQLNPEMVHRTNTFIGSHR